MEDSRQEEIDDLKYEIDKRYVDKALQTSLALWSSLLTVNGILIATFSVLALILADINKLVFWIIGLCLLSCLFSLVLIVWNFTAIKKVYFKIGTLNTESEEELTEEQEKHNIHFAQRICKYNNIRELTVKILLFIEVLIIIFLFFTQQGNAFGQISSTIGTSNAIQDLSKTQTEGIVVGREASTFFLNNLLFPIAVAIITYLLVDRLGEWRKRRKYSRLGIAIIESLQEEIKHGIALMLEAIKASKIKSSPPPSRIPPRKSWYGMPTIADDVLLRIIETSSGRRYEGFHPKDSRIHCKNYFVHICPQYDQAIKQSRMLFNNNQDWRPPIHQLLDEDKDDFIRAAKGVYQMLEHAKELLKINASAWLPK